MTVDRIVAKPATSTAKFSPTQPGWMSEVSLHNEKHLEPKQVIFVFEAREFVLYKIV